MSISLKSQREVEYMREAGRLLALVHEEMRKAIRPGMTTYQIDKLGEEVIRSFGCVPSFLNYNGFPASICTSVNDVIIHGIPSKKHVVHEGDIVSLDAGLIYKGYHSDAARTVAVGEVSPEAQKLMDVTKQSFFEGIKYAKAGNYLHDISAGIENYVRQFGFGIIREYTGHGIGAHLHEDPSIPNYKPIGRGPKLRVGMTLAIEPMITLGSYRIRTLDDGWTVKTADESLAAHYENTIVITEGEPEILTLESDAT